MKRRNLELIIAWLDALRRRDLNAMRSALDPAVRWQGLRDELSCDGPDEVVAGFVAERDEGYDIGALELIPTSAHVVLAIRRAELRAIDGIELDGQIYDVFTINNGTITRIEDHARREQALTAAGLPDPAA
jgi:hypothetical protein